MKIVLHRDGTFTVDGALMGHWTRNVYYNVPWWARCHCSKVIDAYCREGFVNNLERHITAAHADVEIGRQER